MWQEQVIFFNMVQEAIEFDSSKDRGFAFTLTPEDEKQCEVWNKLSTSKLQEVIDTAREAYKWQSTDKAKAFENKSFNKWFASRPVALRPIYWEISSDAYTRWKKEYEILKKMEIFGVRRWVEDED